MTGPSLEEVQTKLADLLMQANMASTTEDMLLDALNSHFGADMSEMQAAIQVQLSNISLTATVSLAGDF
jgi:DEK C terminal domain